MNYVLESYHDNRTSMLLEIKAESLTEAKKRCEEEFGSGYNDYLLLVHEVNADNMLYCVARKLNYPESEWIDM